MSKPLPLPSRVLIAGQIAVLSALPWAAQAATPTTDLPEPDSLWLVGLALGLLVWFNWRRRG